MLDKLRPLNKIEIKSVKSIDFSKYGKIIKKYDFKELLERLDKTQVPENGTVYIPSYEEMEKLKIFSTLRDSFYGGMPIQIGYCNGKNTKLNALEYHKSSEINISSTGLVLLVGMIQKIKNNKYDSKNIEAFYLPKGIPVEIYQTTLHFAPCSVAENGFRCIVVLQMGTNLDINYKIKKNDEESELLFKINKWLLVHKDKENLIKNGARNGIVGENIEIKF